jgi:hypothetical protein
MLKIILSVQLYLIKFYKFVDDKPIKNNSMMTSLRVSSINYRFLLSFLLVFAAFQLFSPSDTTAQIWEPEGLNMPGAWNGWTNPPTNNLALASNTQIPGGRVTRIIAGTPYWQTIFSVATSGGDLVGGTYPWLFTSGPTSGPWNNKWANVNVTLNTLQLYTWQNGPDNTITITDGKWYTVNFEDAGYMDVRAIFMETSAEPVSIATVSVPAATVNPGEQVTVTITTSLAPSAEEVFYLRYSSDAWLTSAALPISMTGTSGTATIPGMAAGTTVSYYAFSSTVAGITDNFDLYTIKLNANGGPNYVYTVYTPPVFITFANLQGPPTGSIETGQAFQVSGRAEIPGITGQPTPAPGIEAWVGYSTTNTDPSTWTSWITASYTGPAGTYDEFSSNLGANIGLNGTYYYATRFRLNAGSYLYGGYSASGGGFWDGTANISGVLTVTVPLVPMQRTLTNITIGEEELMCYDAKETITVAGSGTYFNVLIGGSVTLIAGQNIVMLPGTTVVSGGYLLGSITTLGVYCNPVTPSPARVTSVADNDPATPDGITLRIFPNPAVNDVSVELSGIAAGTTSRVELAGIRGNQLMSVPVSGSGQGSLSLAGLPRGVYFVRIISGSKIRTCKLVKQ